MEVFSKGTHRGTSAFPVIQPVLGSSESKLTHTGILSH